MDLQTLKSFFMLCTILNVGMLILISLLWFLMRDFIYSMHTKLFEIDRKAFDIIFYSFIGLYKILVFIFALVPWLALVIAG